MKFVLFPFVLGFVCSNIISTSNGQRAKNKMYEPIHGISSCFRRMNGTHQTGCSSSREGSTGVIQMVNDEKDLDKILKSDNGLQYIPVLPVVLFTKEITHRLQNSERISGLVVYGLNDTSTWPEHFSHEDTCPNRYSNMDGTCGNDWNEFGTGILQMDFKFPVFYINKEDQIKKIEDCYEKFNNFDFENQPVRSLCSLQLEGFMFASIDTPTCIRRSSSSFNLNPVKFCDPLGDQNVWGSLFPMGNSSLYSPDVTITNGMKYIIFATRLDTTSLFHELTPGAKNPVTGLVTLLVTAMKLKTMIPNYEKRYGKNVLFVLFHGETYDYIGSQRFVYDMEQGVFPVPDYSGKNEQISHLKPEDVELIVEINSLSMTDNIHVYTLEEQVNFITLLKKNDKNIKTKSGQIPPSSYQSFHRANHTIPGVIITDHGNHYTNMYYNSIFDDAANINFTYVEVADSRQYHSPPGSIQGYVDKISNVFAKSLYEAVTNNEHKSDIEDAGYVINELFHCYLESANCLIHRAIQRKKFHDVPLSLYVGVTVSPNILTSLIGLTLAWFTGNKISDESCDGSMPSYIYRHFNMSESLDNLNATNCYRTSINFTDAESPAFIIDGYDWKSGKYSTWSESIWRDFSVRLFLKPSAAHEYMTFAIGFSVLVISFLAVLFVDRKSTVLFETTREVSPASC